MVRLRPVSYTGCGHIRPNLVCVWVRGPHHSRQQSPYGIDKRLCWCSVIVWLCYCDPGTERYRYCKSSLPRQTHRVLSPALDTLRSRKRCRRIYRLILLYRLCELASSVCPFPSSRCLLRVGSAGGDRVRVGCLTTLLPLARSAPSTV